MSLAIDRSEEEVVYTPNQEDSMELLGLRLTADCTCRVSGVRAGMGPCGGGHPTVQHAPQPNGGYSAKKSI